MALSSKVLSVRTCRTLIGLYVRFKASVLVQYVHNDKINKKGKARYRNLQVLDVYKGTFSLH